MTKDNTNQRRRSFMTETTATKPGFEQPGFDLGKAA